MTQKRRGIVPLPRSLCAELRSSLGPGFTLVARHPADSGDVINVDEAVACAGPIVFLDAASRAPAALLRSRLRRGERSLYVYAGIGLEHRSAAALLARRAAAHVRRRLPERLIGPVVTAALAAAAELELPTVSPTADAPVLLAARDLGPGGSERQLVTLAAGLRNDGVAAEIVLLDAAGPASMFFGSAAHVAGVDVVDASAPGWPVPPPTLVAKLRRLRRLLTSIDDAFADDVLRACIAFLQRDPAVVHAFLDHPSCVCGVAGILLGVPRIVLHARSMTPRHFDFFQPWHRAVYRWLVAQPNVRLAANSRAGAADYAEWLGVDARRIAVVENGVDSPSARARRAAVRGELGIADDVPVIGYVGRFAAEKRLELFLAAAAETAPAFPGMVTLLAGGTVEQLKRIVPAVQLARGVRTVGQVRDVSGLLAACDVVMLTSRVEGIPNVLIEAQQQGTPVITVDAGGAREAVVDGGGVVVAPESRALARAATGILLQRGDPGMRDAIERTARDRFSVARFVAASRALHAGPQ